MRLRKVRGHKRRLKHIESWRNDNLSIDLADYLLNVTDRYYAKIRVHPWSGLSLTNSVFPEPTGNTKLHILNALLDIYEEWKKQLDTLQKPYYLKIWLFEPRFSNSQVVCAIGESIDFYNNSFTKPSQEKPFIMDNYGMLKSRLKDFNYDYRLDEDHFNNCEVGDQELYATREDFMETQKWFNRLLKKPHQTYRLDEPMGEIVELYSFKRGDIWLVEKKKNAL